MPCRVGSPSTYRLTSCPSAGQRQATALVAGAGPVGCGGVRVGCTVRPRLSVTGREPPAGGRAVDAVRAGVEARSEEHTSELQSRENLVCRLLLEKKKYE